MSTRMKVMTVIGTRPEIIRLCEVIRSCDAYFDHLLVHTGQNWDYSLNEVFFTDLELRNPDHFLNCVGEHLGQTIGNVISNSYELMRREKPDALLIIGDTNSALCAISAKRLKIPVFHMEAGNRCFDENVPEEINRRIVDHISDVNLAYTEHSRRYLMREGIRPEFVFVTGSPIPEVIGRFLPKIIKSDVIERMHLKPREYFVVSAHREENIDHEASFRTLIDSLNAVAVSYGVPIIVSTHPRTRKRLADLRPTVDPLICFSEPFGFLDYVQLQKNARCVLSDSGTLSEESAILGFPAVLIRTSTERPEVVDQGSILLGSLQSDDVLRSIELAVKTSGIQDLVRPPDYESTAVSTKVVRLISSYVPIIRDKVWHNRGL